MSPVLCKFSELGCFVIAAENEPRQMEWRLLSSSLTILETGGDQYFFFYYKKNLAVQVVVRWYEYRLDLHLPSN